MDFISEISHWWSGLVADPDRLLVVFSVLFGIATFLIAITVYFFLRSIRDPLRKRVESVTEIKTKSPHRSHERSTVQALGESVMPKAGSDRSEAEALLRHAGFRTAGAVQLYYGIRLLSVVGTPIIFLSVVLPGHFLPLVQAIPAALVLIIPGLLVPKLALRKLAARRQDRLRRGLPDAMDLLVVCAEAGLGLNAGIQRVAEEISMTHPELADELGLFAMHTRAGMDSTNALKDLDARTGLDEVQSLVAMLLQSMRFGTSIADALRIFSEELRDKRLQRAQEKAARISTLILFPLIFCLLPSFFLVVLGPTVIGVMRVLSGTGIAR